MCEIKFGYSLQYSLCLQYLIIAFHVYHSIRCSRLQSLLEIFTRNCTFFYQPHRLKKFIRIFRSVGSLVPPLLNLWHKVYVPTHMQFIASPQPTCSFYPSLPHASTYSLYLPSSHPIYSLRPYMQFMSPYAFSVSINNA